jgi:hypothetical protein
MMHYKKKLKKIRKIRNKRSLHHTGPTNLVFAQHVQAKQKINSTVVLEHGERRTEEVVANL